MNYIITVYWGHRAPQNYNAETLAVAVSKYREMQHARNVSKIVLSVILDEWQPLIDKIRR